MASSASAILGIYSFFLPNTPPKIGSDKKISIREILSLDALAMLKDRGFLFFFFASILICIPLAFYYQHANQFLNEIGMKAAASKMILGQISEVLFLLLLPLFIKRYGIKRDEFVRDYGGDNTGIGRYGITTDTESHSMEE